jgi:hypothetical protein
MSMQCVTRTLHGFIVQANLPVLTMRVCYSAFNGEIYALSRHQFAELRLIHLSPSPPLLEAYKVRAAGWRTRT